jgi:cold shock CspA family protein
VHRVEAILFDAVGNISAARTAYEAAIELEPGSAPLRLWFAQFLFRQLQDLDEALRQLIIAESIDPNRFAINLETARISLALKDFTRADALVERLLSVESTLLPGDRKKLVDFMLRYFKDKAEESCDNNDANAALGFLRRMGKTYIECPRNLHDQKMRDKLRRAIPTALECKKLMRHQGDVHPDLNVMLDWLARITGDRVASSKLDTLSGSYSKEEGYLEGYVHRTLPGFGFIRTDDGKEYFFHFSEASRSTSREGQKVRFQMGIDPKGRPCAVNIRSTSSSASA